MASWPETLPQYVDANGFTETIQDPVIRTDMEAGPQKARLRFTAVPEKYTITMPLTATQRATFLTFFKSTIHYGVDEFMWVHPVTRDERYCRFTSVYQLSPNGIDFTLSISMEVLP